MEGFGWVLFVVGSILIIISGMVGSATTSALLGANIANLPGVLIGAALMISGAVFAAVGELIKEVKSMKNSMQKD